MDGGCVWLALDRVLQKQRNALNHSQQRIPSTTLLVFWHWTVDIDNCVESLGLSILWVECTSMTSGSSEPIYTAAQTPKHVCFPVWFQCRSQLHNINIIRKQDIKQWDIPRFFSWNHPQCWNTVKSVHHFPFPTTHFPSSFFFLLLLINKLSRGKRVWVKINEKTINTKPFSMWWQIHRNLLTVNYLLMLING